VERKLYGDPHLAAHEALMSLPKFAAFGWELADPRVAAANLADADLWNSADAVFLSTRAVATLWSELAPKSEGAKTRKKPSAVREQIAWNRVAVFVRNLRRLLRRGGLLVCRLDPPTERVKVRFPPLNKCFPDGKAIDSYVALSAVHAMLAEWSSPRLAGEARLEALEAGSPWSGYLQVLAGDFAPAVAIDPQSNTSAVLARDPLGRVLAAADSQVVLVPPLAVPQPEREAELLVEAALRARSLREAAAPRAVPAEAAADIERLRQDERRLDEQIERLRRERETVRRSLRQREQLGNLIAGADASQFAAAVAQALAILGMSVRGSDSADALRIAAEGPLVVEAIPAAVSPGEGSYVVSGRLRRAPRTSGGAAGASPEIPARKLRLVMESAGELGRTGMEVGSAETVVPARELFQAAMAVLASPEDDTLRMRIRQSLHETSGIYRFAQ
jgi:hypothetical protein